MTVPCAFCAAPAARWRQYRHLHALVCDACHAARIARGWIEAPPCEILARKLAGKAPLASPRAAEPACVVTLDDMLS